MQVGVSLLDYREKIKTIILVDITIDFPALYWKARGKNGLNNFCHLLTTTVDISIST